MVQVAYGLGSHVTRHVVNDVVAGRPVTVTYCDKNDCAGYHPLGGRACEACGEPEDPFAKSLCYPCWYYPSLAQTRHRV